MSRSEKIKVALRLRPSEDESDSLIWTCNESTVALVESQRPKLVEAKAIAQGTNTTFQFGDCHLDRCFGPSVPTRPIYDHLIRHIIQASRDGYSGSILAYGQTGSGKSYLMSGDSGSAAQGLIHFALEELVTNVQDTELTAALFELYNEQVFDLLATEGEKQPGLKVKEDPETGFFIQGLRDVSFQSYRDIEELLTVAERRRHYAATRLNHHSSRAHWLLRLTVKSTHKDQGLCRVAKSTLHFVDLAGSERLSLCKEVSDELTSESRHINRSLFYLCQVISRLSETHQKTHVPYRNSALTKILRSSLGGTAHTAIICTAMATSSHIDMTLSTLRFGAKARCIDNQVIADTYLEPCDHSSCDTEDMLQSLRKEVDRVTWERDDALRLLKENPPMNNTSAYDFPDRCETGIQCERLNELLWREMEEKRRTLETHVQRLKEELTATKVTLEDAFMTQESLSKKLVHSSQKFFKSEAMRKAKNLREEKRKLALILSGKGLPRLSISKLRHLECLLFSAIDRVKVISNQDTRFRKLNHSPSPASLSSTSSSEGSEDFDVEGVVMSSPSTKTSEDTEVVTSLFA